MLILIMVSPGQISDVPAAASSLAIESGAEPDDHVPLMLHNMYDPDWIDEDEDEDDLQDTTHKGGECLDKARIRFQYFVCPK